MVIYKQVLHNFQDTAHKAKEKEKGKSPNPVSTFFAGSNLHKLYFAVDHENVLFASIPMKILKGELIFQLQLKSM